MFIIIGYKDFKKLDELAEFCHLDASLSGAKRLTGPYNAPNTECALQLIEGKEIPAQFKKDETLSDGDMRSRLESDGWRSTQQDKEDDYLDYITNGKYKRGEDWGLDDIDDVKVKEKLKAHGYSEAHAEREAKDVRDEKEKRKKDKKVK